MILVTGAGTLGTALTKKLVEDYKSVTVVDYSEEALWTLEESVKADWLTTILADIRDRERMRLAMKGVETVFHTAALKHVKYTNDSPIECIKTNVEGTSNLLTLALETGVKTFVNMSSDKACSPNNIYGDSKKMGERLTTWANSICAGTYFSVRSGNFLGSRGSVFDRWKKQRNNCSIKLTSPNMNRFFIKPDEMAEWLIEMSEGGKGSIGGTVCTPFLKNLNMGTVANVVAEAWGVEVEEVGPGHGEKLDEMIINGEEATRTYQHDWLGWWTFPYTLQNQRLFGAISTNVVPVLGKEETRKYLEGII